VTREARDGGRLDELDLRRLGGVSRRFQTSIQACDPAWVAAEGRSIGELPRGSRRAFVDLARELTNRAFNTLRRHERRFSGVAGAGVPSILLNDTSAARGSGPDHDWFGVSTGAHRKRGRQGH